MADSESSDRCSSPTDTISSLNSALNNENTVDDDRIECTNTLYLDKIYEVAVRNVTQLAESHLTEDKARFVNQFSEVFKSFIQENVTVSGLPWLAHEEKTTIEKEREQMQETTEMLLSKLSKAVEKTAEKRKFNTRGCIRVHGLHMKHQRYNLKKARIESDASLPSTSSSSGPKSFPDHSDEITSVYSDILSAQQKIALQSDRLSVMKEHAERAKEIAHQHKEHSETLYDTGYISE